MSKKNMKLLKSAIERKKKYQKSQLREKYIQKKTDKDLCKKNLNKNKFKKIII